MELASQYLPNSRPTTVIKAHAERAACARLCHVAAINIPMIQEVMRSQGFMPAFESCLLLLLWLKLEVRL